MMSNKDNTQQSTETEMQNKDDLISELLRHADKREAAPVHVKNRVKHQLKVHWQEKNKKRKTQKNWFVFGSVASVMSLVMIMLFNGLLFKQEPAMTHVYLDRVQGQVKASDLTQYNINNDRTNMLLPGTMIETLYDGYATLSLKTGGNLRLNHNSQLIVNDNNAFTLSFGTVYFDSGYGKGAKTPITIHTLHGDIQDIGTQFAVTSNKDQIQISVREGLIELNNKQGMQSLEAGYQLVSEEEGIFEKSKLSPQDIHWAWVNNVAPEFKLEGKNLNQFLTWISREHGLKLVFLESYIEQLSELVTLHGDIKDLSLQQALDTVFSTTELNYQIDENQLQVFK